MIWLSSLEASRTIGVYVQFALSLMINTAVLSHAWCISLQPKRASEQLLVYKIGKVMAKGTSTFAEKSSLIISSTYKFLPLKLIPLR